MNCLTLQDLPPAPTGKTGWPWTQQTPPADDASVAAWPRISIVTPSFNHAAYLEEAIRSVLLQGYPNLEYFVVDGGSTDDSAAIIEKYRPWLTHAVSEVDRGQSHAINKGLARCTGEITNWLCSDDLLLPGALQAVARHFMADPSADIVVGGCRQIRVKENNRIIDHPAYPWRLKSMPVGVPVTQPSCFYRSRLLSRPGPIDESFLYQMDVELWNFFDSRGARWKLVDEYLSIDRFTGDNKTATAGDAIALEAKRIYERYARHALPLTFWHRAIGYPLRKFKKLHRGWLARAGAYALEAPLTLLLSPFYGYQPVRAMFHGAFDSLSRS
jgi:glycosyltransferase involved in cell wall biosynthesis